MKSGFDYVIVGGGSAGCVLAARLSEDAECEVLLVEAGPSDSRFDSWKIEIPAALRRNLIDDKYNWHFHSVAQPNLNGRKIYCPRGRVLGGSSSLNAMAYVRGHARDYERWGEAVGGGWDYAGVLPYFKKCETYSEGGCDYRGDAGPLFVTAGMTGKTTGQVNPLFATFVEAGGDAGYPLTADSNGFQQEGFGRMDMTIHRGRRQSASAAYLRPLGGRRNLTILTGARATKIALKNGRALGIEIAGRGFVSAAREVVICAGAALSPHLLLLSGIGGGDDLRALGIEPKIPLPGVGRNLQDHLEVYVQQECEKPVTLRRSTTFFGMATAGARWLLLHDGDCASSHMEAGAFVKSDSALSQPDIQFHFLPTALNDHGRVLYPGHAYQAHVGTMRPQSRGVLRLRDSDPFSPPLIDPNYLAEEKDLVDMRACVKIAREVFSRRAFDSVRGKEIWPGAAVKTDSEIDAWIRASSETAYHLAGTCRMGKEGDAEAVVDSEGRVFGAEGLRVADASIMPDLPSGNLNAPVIMMAEKIADKMRGRELPPSRAPFE